MKAGKARKVQLHIPASQSSKQEGLKQRMVQAQKANKSPQHALLQNPETAALQADFIKIFIFFIHDFLKAPDLVTKKLEAIHKLGMDTIIESHTTKLASFKKEMKAFKQEPQTPERYTKLYKTLISIQNMFESAYQGTFIEDPAQQAKARALILDYYQLGLDITFFLIIDNHGKRIANIFEAETHHWCFTRQDFENDYILSTHQVLMFANMTLLVRMDRFLRLTPEKTDPVSEFIALYLQEVSENIKQRNPDIFGLFKSKCPEYLSDKVSSLPSYQTVSSEEKPLIRLIVKCFLDRHFYVQKEDVYVDNHHQLKKHESSAALKKLPPLFAVIFYDEYAYDLHFSATIRFVTYMENAHDPKFVERYRKEHFGHASQIPYIDDYIDVNRQFVAYLTLLKEHPPTPYNLTLLKVFLLKHYEYLIILDFTFKHYAELMVFDFESHKNADLATEVIVEKRHKHYKRQNFGLAHLEDLKTMLAYVKVSYDFYETLAVLCGDDCLSGFGKPAISTTLKMLSEQVIKLQTQTEEIKNLAYIYDPEDPEYQARLEHEMQEHEARAKLYYDGLKTKEEKQKEKRRKKKEFKSTPWGDRDTDEELLSDSDPEVDFVKDERCELDSFSYDAMMSQEHYSELSAGLSSLCQESKKSENTSLYAEGTIRLLDFGLVHTLRLTRNYTSEDAKTTPFLSNAHFRKLQSSYRELSTHADHLIIYLNQHSTLEPYYDRLKRSMDDIHTAAEKLAHSMNVAIERGNERLMKATRNRQERGLGPKAPSDNTKWLKNAERDNAKLESSIEMLENAQYMLESTSCTHKPPSKTLHKPQAKKTERKKESSVTFV